MSAVNLLRRAHRAWSDYWFAGIDARSVALMRITLGILLIWGHLAMWPELTQVIGPESLIASVSVGREFNDTRLALYDLAATTGQLHALHAAMLLPLFAFTVGLGGRVSGLLSMAVLMSLHDANPWMQNGGDRLLRVWTLSLLLAPYTRALSVDAWIRRQRGKPIILTVPVTAHRMIQLQTIIIYGMSGLDKMEGSTWRSGSAVYYSLSNLNFNRFPGLLDPILSWRPAQIVMQLQTWVTLGWEFLFPVLILFWPTRILALVVGVVVHVGIGSFVMVGSFSLAILWTYLAFLDPDRLGAWTGRMVNWVRRQPAP